jgi:hypothetical protein
MLPTHGRKVNRNEQAGAYRNAGTADGPVGFSTRSGRTVPIGVHSSLAPFPLSRSQGEQQGCPFP